jgi:hypothetical protein
MGRIEQGIFNDLRGHSHGGRRLCSNKNRVIHCDFLPGGQEKVEICAQKVLKFCRRWGFQNLFAFNY